MNLSPEIEISEMYTNGIFCFMVFNNQDNDYCVKIISNSIYAGLCPQKVFCIIPDNQNLNSLNSEYIINKLKEQFINLKIDANGDLVYIYHLSKYRKMILNHYNKQPKTLIAITGSSGKSSTCYILYSILQKYLHKKTFISSSIGIGSDNLNISKLSCIPFADTRYNLYKFHNCEVGILEATSHGLKQERFFGLELDIGVFTSLHENHLDYHKTMEDYIKSKLNIIDYIKRNGFFFINKSVLNNNEFTKKHQVLLKTKLQEKNIQLIEYCAIEGLPNNINDYEKENISCALLILQYLNYHININDLNITKLLPDGRFKTVGENNNKTILINDGAHSPTQIKTVLEIYRNMYHNKKMIIIYGVAGHRLHGDMQNAHIIAEFLKNEDQFFVVDDNPQYVDSEQLRKDIVSSCKNNKITTEYINRFEAIANALKIENACVLVLGKASETQNVINFRYTKELWNKFFVKNVSYLNFINECEMLIENTELKDALLEQLEIFDFKFYTDCLAYKQNNNFSNNTNIKLKITEETGYISYSIYYNELEISKEMLKSSNKSI